MSQAPSNYSWMIDNTNVIYAHELVSGEFAKKATGVNVELLINGKKYEIEVFPWETIFTVFAEIIDEEAVYKNLNDIEVVFVRCYSDAARWS